MQLIDAFNGEVTHFLRGHTNPHNLTLSASFTPDSKYILVGGGNGHITVYSRESGNIVHEYNTDPTEHIAHVAFNTKYHMFGSAGTKTVRIWNSNL